MLIIVYCDTGFATCTGQYAIATTRSVYTTLFSPTSLLLTYVKADGPMKDLFRRCKGLGPDESATLLAATDITKSHNIASLTGQSDPDGPLHSHYLAFVDHKGDMLELDGYSHAIPLTHGPIQGDLLHVRRRHS